MKNLFKSRLSDVLNQFNSLKLLSWDSPYILLFDSSTAAQDIALMLGGQWDGCNGIIMSSPDEVAVNTAAKLYDASWCKNGDSVALLIRLMPDQLIRRYAVGERNFSNANLRCAMLASHSLREITLCYAKLNWANFSEANLSGSDLTAADLSDANLRGASLSKTSLMRTTLVRANLELANLSEANLSKADLTDACLRGADLRGANLTLADLRGADLSQAMLSGANLTDAKFIQSDLEKAILTD